MSDMMINLIGAATILAAVYVPGYIWPPDERDRDDA